MNHKGNVIVRGSIQLDDILTSTFSYGRFVNFTRCIQCTAYSQPNELASVRRILWLVNRGSEAVLPCFSSAFKKAETVVVRPLAAAAFE